MLYTVIDYKVLAAVHGKKRTLDTLLEAACASFPYPLSKDALAFSLGKLCAGGYIEGYALTDKGLAFFKDNKRFLESKAGRNARLCALLCAERPDGELTPYELSDAAYLEACDALRRKYSIPLPELTVAQGEDSLILRLAGYCAEDEDEMHDGQSIAVNIPSLCALADSVSQFCRDGRHHKCCLYAEGAPAYVATVSVSDRSTRLSISKILFNRQRFIGKRDGELDYAQCGDSLYDRTDDKIAVQITYALLQAEHLIKEDFPYRELQAWEI